jgi:hypothetical protein
MKGGRGVRGGVHKYEVRLERRANTFLSFRPNTGSAHTFPLSSGRSFYNCRTV